jgi:hypothetical protein
MSDQPERALRIPEWVFAAISYGLYALLLESVVEGFVFGSEVRWIALGVVGLYAVASYGLWNRVGPRAKAVAGAAVLLALAAVSAWRLDSAAASGGYSVATLSGSKLAELLSAGALMVGFLAVWPLGWVPERHRLKVRVVLALLFAWAFSPFAYGFATGADYDGLFLGRGFWEWPPFWLQGAYLGIAVLLPLALLASIVNVSLSLARRRFTPLSARMFEGLVVVLVALMAAPTLSGLGLPHLTSRLSLPALPGFQVRSGDAEPSYAEDLTSEDLETIAGQVERGLEALAEEAQQIPRESFDPQAIVAQVGTDPQELFEWVRDRTYWAPYRGSLRGPIGVLMDRTGNSLDRSLLLAELLRLSGQETRLAHAPLDEPLGERLLSQLRAAPDQPLPSQPVDAEASRRRLGELAEKYGLDREEAQRNARLAAARAAELSERLSERVAAQVPQLVELVGPRTDEQIERVRQQQRADRLASIRDHWWVEYKEQERWEPMDTLRADAEPGSALAEATRTVAATGPGQPIVLDAKDSHEIDIRIVIERFEDGDLTQVPVLSHTVRPGQLIGRSITVTHQPMAWPGNLDLLSSAAPLEAIQSAALEQKEWIPVLRIGSSVHYENAFTDAGQTSPARVGGGMFSVLGKQAEGLGSATSVLDNLFAPADPTTPKSRHLTAEWIEYEIRTPGREPRKIRRQLFDLVGPAERAAGRPATVAVDEARRLERGLALLGTSHILVAAAAFSSDYVNHLATSATLANGRALPELLRRAASPIDEKMIGQLDELTPFPGELYDFVLARQRLNPLGREVRLCAANVFSHHRALRMGEDGRLSLRRSFDIVANEVSVVSQTDTDPLLAPLTQGVLDTNAEAILAGPGGCADGAAELFATADAEDIDWVALRGPGDAQLDQLSLSADVLARIERDLTEGYTVISPRSAESLEGRSVAWWRVDPRTGQTLGIDQRGHGAAVEYQMSLPREIGFIVSLFGAGFYGGYMGCRSLSPQSTQRVCVACGILAGLALATFVLTVPITAPLIFAGGAGTICGR